MQGGIASCIPDSHLYRVTNTRYRIGTVFSPDDGHIVARNMQRKAINILRKIVRQVGSIYKTMEKFES
jgi:Fe2+ or Zn2+ uptake regulation protein